MLLTPKLLIPELEPEDLANLPLYLQRVAERVEAEAAAIDDDLTSALTRPMGIWTNGAAEPAVGIYPAWQPLGVSVFPTVLYKNYSLSYSSAVPVYGQSRKIFPGPGVYEISWSCRVDTTGAISANSPRAVYCNVVRFTGGGWEIVSRFGNEWTLETDTQLGFTDLAGSGTVEIGDDYQNCYLYLALSHTNGASTCFVPAFGTVVCLRQLGSVDVIEVD